MVFPTPTTTLQHAIRQASSTVTNAPTTSPLYFLTSQYVTVPGVTNEHVTVPDKTITMVLPTCIQTIEPDANGYLPPGTCHAIWDYYPSFSGSLTFLLLFALLTVAHVYQAAMYKKRFCWAIIMASLWEAVAYIFRTVSTRHQNIAGVYTVYKVFILVSPLWVNAFVYMLFKRMVHYFAPSREVLSIPAFTLGAGFMLLHIAASIVQLVGASMGSPLAVPEERAHGMHVYMAGMGLQLALIVVFIAFALKFHFDPHRLTAQGGGSFSATWRSSWLSLLIAIYASLACVILRIVYRFIEFSSLSNAVDNPVSTKEGYFYALEAAPMVLAILAFNIFHPGLVFVDRDVGMPGFFGTCVALVRRRMGWREPPQSPEKVEVFMGDLRENYPYNPVHQVLVEAP
ncbi:hypothetical protein DL766_010244 [Monosporascus sp. MC13-8B]|uniref:RTA1 domain protein n=1 Tax=Monosporascus cannonballus TaxID=155416 RepID=A0ABY0HAQ3_9PEZI|nr:hypothetical protein DL762_003530 [Monosporascus cannonballus]RYO96518.1 hypothetical protein DL763_003137 [Monosporascus cannonballus]RYP02700.1 hypothetical protein DL766_010244 [Monosporascus sp. MC13-8B]